jgi:hypothetical protein
MVGGAAPLKRGCVCAVLTAVAVGFAACAATVPVSTRPIAGAASHTSARSDSLELYEELLARGAATDEAEAEAIAAELGTHAETFVGPAAWWDGYYLEFEALTGYRASERLEAGRRGGSPSRRPTVALSVRRDGARSGGYAEVRGAGPITRLVAGGIRPRFGEGMALGVRYLPFASPRPARVDAGVVPTSSIWGHKTGAAATLDLGRHEATVAGWRDPGGSFCTWSWWLCRTASATLGLAAGTHGGARAADAALFAERRLGGVTLAGEVSMIDTRAFAAAHAVVEAAGRWNVTLFDAPSPGGFAAGVADGGEELRRQSGGALHHTSVWRGLSTRLTLYGGTRRIGASVLRRRRVDASLGGRPGGPGKSALGRWTVAVRLSEQSEAEPPDQAIDARCGGERHREGQLRCTWSGGGASLFRQRFRISARLDEHREATVMGTVGWTLIFRGCEASCEVNNYEVGRGATGYIVQAGVPGPEAVSAVSRSGTDISARLRLGAGVLRLVLYWDKRWGKPPRWYLGAGARL